MIKTVSLDVAKQLKEAGWNTETEKCFIDRERIIQMTFETRFVKRVGFMIEDAQGDIFGEKIKEEEILPAPTISELLGELPVEIDDYILEISPSKKEWCVEYEDIHNNGWNANFLAIESSKSLEDCLALLWIELKERRLI